MQTLTYFNRFVIIYIVFEQNVCILSGLEVKDNWNRNFVVLKIDFKYK